MGYSYWCSWCLLSKLFASCIRMSFFSFFIDQTESLLSFSHVLKMSISFFFSVILSLIFALRTWSSLAQRTAKVYRQWVSSERNSLFTNQLNSLLGFATPFEDVHFVSAYFSAYYHSLFFFVFSAPFANFNTFKVNRFFMFQVFIWFLL